MTLPSIHIRSGLLLGCLFLPASLPAMLVPEIGVRGADVDSTEGVAAISQAAAAIDRRIWVNLIRVADDDGTDLANVFGNPDTTLFIMNRIDEIWAQAGIDIAYTRGGATTLYNNSFVNDGAPDAYPRFGGVDRPSSDLQQILSVGDAAGVGDPSNTVIDAYFVQNAPLFERGEFYTQGVARIGAPGTAITNRDDPALMSEFRQGVVAALFAHEIGHNLGLRHVSDSENLLFPTASGQFGLTAEQIEIARNSSLAVLVPEPGSFFLVSLAGLLALRRSRAA